MRPSPAIERLTSSSARRFGVFTLVHALGKGGFAPVWLAREVYGTTELRTVAIKLFATGEGRDGGERSATLGETAQRRERIFEEARALCQVEHPNIVRFYAMHEDAAAGVVGLVMEHVRGTPLDVRLDELQSRGATCSLDEVIAVGIAVASALSAVHQVGLVHRDVKPANIVESAGVYKLIDFGIAAAERAPAAPAATDMQGSHGSQKKRVVLDDLPLDVSIEAAEAPSTTSPQSAVASTAFTLTGTIGYIDPQCTATLSMATTASDLYALGATLYECVAGHVPAAIAARRAGAQGLRGEVLDGREAPPPLAEIVPGLPPGLAQLVDRLVSPSPEQRPRSAEAVAWELERIRREIAGRSRPLPPEDVGPFRGLGRFEQEDRDVYFGRTVEIAASLEMIRSRGVLALIGASGSGKSSLARAGVLPAIAEGGLGRWPKAWDTVIVSPGLDPRASIAKELANILPDAGARSADALVSALGERAQASGRGVVILIDQLEELATLSSGAGRDFAVRFIAQLAAQAIPGVRCVVAARRDLLDPLLAMGELGRALTRGSLLVSAMTDSSWGEVIDQALGAYGYTLEDDALRAELLVQLAGTATAMPLVQFALTQLWERRDRGAKTIPRGALAAIGGIAGALQMHAEATLARHALDDPGVMDVARRILLAMTTAQGTRRARPEGELVPIDPRAAAMLERLERARLVVREADGVTLAHEALLVQWGRLRGWIEGAREDRLLAEALERDAREWEGGHGVEPWKKRRLAAARDLVRYGEEDLSDAARAFVRAGQAAERRGTIALATVTATVIVSLGIAAVYSLTQARKATAALADAYAAQAVVLSADPGRELDALALAFKSAALGPSRPELAQRAMAETALAADRAGLSRSVPLGDHDVDVNTVVVSPDGRLVATAADDGSIHTWDLNGAPLGAVRGQPGSVTMLAISPDSARVASMGTHGDLRIRELATGREVAAVTVKLDSADEGRVRVRYAPDGAVFVRSLGSGSVQTFDGSTLKEVAPPVARSVAVSIDGRRAVVVEKDAFSVIDVRTGATLRRTIRPDASTFPYDVTDSGAVASSTGSSVDRWTVDGQITPGPALNAPARFVRISASGERAFASVENGRGFNGGVLVDFAAHKLVTLSDYGESIFEAKWTRDGRRILTQGALTMHVWEATTGALEARISPPGNLKAAAITADGSRVAIATTDGARLWEVPPESGFEHHANSDQPFFATYLPGGDRIVTVGTDAIEWDAHSGALIHKLAGAGTPQSAVVASDGDSLVVATRTPERAIEWQVWQLKPPSLTATILAAGPVSPASMSADGDTLAGVCRNGGACIWNASDGKLRQRISANDQDVLDAAISPDGQLVAISRLDKTVEIARTTDGAQRAMLTGHTDAVRGAVFSGDGRSVVTWGDDRTARLWSIDGSLRHVFAGHSRRVLSAALAADGSRLMTAAEDHRAILWDTVSGAKLGTVYDWTTRWGNETSGLVLDEGSLEPERWNALHSPFSADGTSVAVPTRNGSTVILDAATGDVRMTVRGAGSKAFTFTFAPDGGHGVAVSTDANVRVVPIATHDFMAVGCFVLDGQKLLTPEERRMCDQAIHGIPEVAPSLAPDYLGYGYVSVTGR